MVDLPIDEPSNGVQAGVVTVPVVSVGLGEGLVAPDAADGVLDHDARARDLPVVGDVCGRAGLVARLLARDHHQLRVPLGAPFLVRLVPLSRCW